MLRLCSGRLLHIDSLLSHQKKSPLILAIKFFHQNTLSSPFILHRSQRFSSKPKFVCACQRHLSTTTGNTDTPSDKDDKTKSKTDPLLDNRKTIVKVMPKSTRPKVDKTQSYTANVFITPVRAMNDYLLSSSELEQLKKFERRSPYPNERHITVYLRRDVELKSLEKWKTLENLGKEKARLLERDRLRYQDSFQLKYLEREQLKQKEDPTKFWSVKGIQQGVSSKSKSSLESFKKPLTPFGVVLFAVGVNGLNCIFKAVAWLVTGSHSMFAETLHSLADTFNQMILAFGIYQSSKQPDEVHPYGWSNFRYITSLISGVGIFFLGAGMSVYHGVSGLMSMQAFDSDNLYWALIVLAGGLVSELGTMMAAILQVRASAKASGISFWQHVRRSPEPSVTVVLLEDMAAVTGVVIAATCMGITYMTGNPIADSVGSLLIGSLLGSVAVFIVYTNTAYLIGRSIPSERKQLITKELENDRMIRALHDIKATDMGGKAIRFKAEVDFDGREITRSYLDKQDLDTMLVEMQNTKTMEEVESFMLKHGENVIDHLGEELDRIESKLKKKYPEIRHVDLEQL